MEGMGETASGRGRRGLERLRGRKGEEGRRGRRGRKRREREGDVREKVSDEDHRDAISEDEGDFYVRGQTSA